MHESNSNHSIPIPNDDSALAITATTIVRYYAVDIAGNKGPVSQTVYYVGDFPLSPTNVATDYDSGIDTTTITDDSVDISWVYADNSSISEYRIYRAYTDTDIALLKQSVVEGYPPPPYLLIGSVANNVYTYSDSSPPVIDGIELYYAVAAVDTDGNVSVGAISDPELVEFDANVTLADENVELRIQRALQWIETNQHESGFWEGQDRIVTTCRVLQSLAEHPEFVRNHRYLINRGLAYIQGHNAKSIDGLARKISTLQQYGWDTRVSYRQILWMKNIRRRLSCGLYFLAVFELDPGDDVRHQGVAVESSPTFLSRLAQLEHHRQARAA